MRKTLPALVLLICVTLSPLGFAQGWLVAEGYVRPYASGGGEPPAFAPTEPTYTARAYFNGALFEHPSGGPSSGCGVLVKPIESAAQNLADAAATAGRVLQLLRAVAWLAALYMVALRLGFKQTVLYVFLSAIVVIISLTIFGPVIGCVGFSSELVSGGYSDVFYVADVRLAATGWLFALALAVLPLAALWWTHTHDENENPATEDGE